MPLQPHMKLISVDDHLIEHPDVWQSRLPAAYREAGPKIVEDDAGVQAWVYEGRSYPTLGLGAVAGKPHEEYGNDPTRYDEMRPGAYDPVERLKDMDLDGVHAHLCFPTFPRFAGTLFLESIDRELALLCVQAWNDFMLDEWCATDRERFIPLSIVPLWDPRLAAEEILRVAAKGSRTVSFPESPVPLGLPSFHTDHWDPVFAAAQATDLPLSMHFGTSGLRPPHSPDAPFAVNIAEMGVNSMLTVCELVFSPVFHKFPDLKIAMSEGGIGWFPWLTERIEYTWERHRFYTGVNTEVNPRQFIQRNFWGCFIEDATGLVIRDRIGIDRILWECDYPHADTKWPHSREYLEKALHDVPEDEAHRIVELNARELFRF